MTRQTGQFDLPSFPSDINILSRPPLTIGYSAIRGTPASLSQALGQRDYAQKQLLYAASPSRTTTLAYFSPEGCEIIFWQTRFPVMLSKAKHLGRE